MQEFLVGYHKTIKNAGRGDTKNRSEIPLKSWDSLMELLFVLQELMEADKSSERFQELLGLLPTQFRQKWHYLLQWGAIFILLAFTAKRGREGIANLRADHFEKLWSEELGIYYYAQIVVIGSKNHKVDDQGMSDEGRGGILPFEKDEYGIIPGRWLELFLSFRDQENPYFFQQPMLPKSMYTYVFNLD